MLIRAAHLRGGGGPTARALATLGKVLAADKNGLTLREAPEGGIYGWGEIDWAAGERYIKVHQSGVALAEILIHLQGAGSARLKEIFAPLGPNALGAGKLRSIFRLLQKAYPGIETLRGYRSTGVRLTRPAELQCVLRRVTGASLTNLEAV